MRKISRIEPTAPLVKPRKRVAAYCRVSADTEQLHRSLSAQVSYYNSLIQKNAEWEFAGVYADSGISGVSAKRREKFQAMLADCRAGKIDIVLTKSISRFARNTVDLLDTVRELKSLGIEVRFEREHINSLSGDGEIMLSILASFAQEESRSISESVKWSIKKRFQQGKTAGRQKSYGYRWGEEHLEIVPDEAEIIKRIYRDFLGGKSMRQISIDLQAENVPTARGGRWSMTEVKLILSNITYTGDMLLQKVFTIDPLTQKKKRNCGELPQYLVENSHTPLIDKETFALVQKELERRSELGNHIFPGFCNSCFSGKIKCGICGGNYVRSAERRRNVVDWICQKKRTKTKAVCAAQNISEKILRPLCCEVLGMAEFDEKAFAERIEKIVVIGERRLAFHLASGEKIEREWTPKPIWTPERRMLWRDYYQHGTSKGTGMSFKEYTDWREKGNGSESDKNYTSD